MEVGYDKDEELQQDGMVLDDGNALIMERMARVYRQ